jgi:nitrous oxidase accessory protein
MGYILCFQIMILIYQTNLKNNGAGVAVMFTQKVKMFNNTFERKLGGCSLWLIFKRNI